MRRKNKRNETKEAKETKEKKKKKNENRFLRKPFFVKVTKRVGRIKTKGKSSL